jgi:hypothetical protein
MASSRPKQFAILMREWGVRKETWEGSLPPIEIVRGKRSRMSDEWLAGLLANYRLRRMAKMNREQFLDHLAEHGYPCLDGYSSPATYLTNRDVVEKYLKRAMRRAREPEFAELVSELETWLQKRPEQLMFLHWVRPTVSSVPRQV